MAEVPPIPAEIKAKVRAMPESEVAAYFGAEASDNHRRNVRALEVYLSTGKHLKEWQKEQKPAEFNPEDFLILVMNVSRETLYRNIDGRFLKMLVNGALDEIKSLKALKLDPALPIMKAHGAPEFMKYLDGEMTLEEATAKAQQNTRNYAKRQLTWMRQQLPQNSHMKIEVQNMKYEDILKIVQDEMKL